ncbi:metal-dependent hydrolase [Paraperlucidibaca sp.]|uniref:metal-dependent hydrolase n=1 Tax=Paraperlucidibaca sp. TaxID=2708021 RepID=UPI0030F46FD9
MTSQAKILNQVNRPTPRRMDFVFDDSIPMDWFGGSPFKTMVLTALSATFPEGERFFVDSVRHYQKRVSPDLAKQVSGFIGQEAHHGREHTAFNAFMGRKGLPMAEIDEFVEKGMKFMRRKLSPERQLAMTCALEHFTAILAELALENPEFFGPMDERVKPLWYWHAIEESEHKAVAFDVFQEQVGSYWIRSSQMVINSIEFAFFSSFHTYQLLKARGIQRDWKMHREGLKELFVKPGWLRKMGKAYLAYYKPSFHPWQRDTTRAMNHWKAVYGIE